MVQTRQRWGGSGRDGRRKILALGLLLVSFIAAAQSPVPCKGPLTEQQLSALARGKVAEARIRQFLTECGVGFPWTEEVKSRLEAAGVSRAILADFAGKAAAAEEEKNLKLKAELAFWESAEKTAGRSLYEEYLRRYPEGQFVLIAKERLAAIEKKEKEAEEQRRAAQAQDQQRMELQRGARHRSEAFLKRLNMEFVTIEPGSFTMGSDAGFDDEKPAHVVRITKAFEIGKYEVTQAQWEAVIFANPSFRQGANLPVGNVSWEDAQRFLALVNERQDQYRFRLPTEAEWEYAARAGTTGHAYGEFSDIGWFDDGSTTREIKKRGLTRIMMIFVPHEVGRKRPNAWGLHDVFGNVSEWCQDWYHEKYYNSSPGNSPPGPPTGEYRVTRGGSWNDDPSALRVSKRGMLAPGGRLQNLGFRCVREAKLP